MTVSLRVHIVTLFPSMFDSWLQQGLVARAIERGAVEVDIVDLRPFGVGRHHVTDDYPFGGGAGMVMKPEPLFASVESIERDASTPVILMSPRGRLLRQPIVEELAIESELVLVSGHYEGVDERVRAHLASDEISIGDYVLSCGELPAMVLTDAVCRLQSGVLARESTVEESFSSGLLEYPQYTRPAVFRDWEVPESLLSGHHAAIAAWRREQSLRLTAARRPDLLESVTLTEEERRNVARWADREPGIDIESSR
jgi:tRNA (guanine37-N1)-methyltransferase